MASCHIFDEDEVCVPTSSYGYKYGLVVESSEYLSSDEEEDEDRVKKGEVKVCWHPSGDESVMPENKLILADRSLMPGDVVRRLICGTDSQRGFIQDMSVKSHVMILGTNQYILNVDAKDILPIQEWDPEQEVTLDSWVGHILEVIEDITVRFQDGARCLLSNAGTLDLEDVDDKRESYSEYVMKNFYPGQVLRGNKLDYEDAKWLHTSKTRGPGKMGTKALYSAPVVVEKVETSRVDVRWICKGFTKTGDGEIKLETPPSCVQGEKLKQMRQLDCFRHCHLQIGDKGYYNIKNTDTVHHSFSSPSQTSPDILKFITTDTVNGLLLNDDNTAAAAGNHTDPIDKDEREEKDHGMKNDTIADDFSDDEFEDINDNMNLSSTENSCHVTKRKGRKRFTVNTKNAKVHKGKKAKQKPRLLEREFKAGERVPVEVCYTFTMCSVMWQDGSVEHQIPSPELFPIHHLDEMEFFPGDFVISSKDSLKTDYGVVTSCCHKERTVMVKWIKPISKDGKPQKPEISDEEELSVYDLADHEDFKFRAGHTVIRVGGYENDPGELEAVGQVFKQNADGTLDIWWPSNKVTQCYPQNLYIISEEFDSDLGSADDWSEEEEEEEGEDEDDSSDASWETETETDDDSDTEMKNKGKQLWYMTDEKQMELDQLLKRIEGSLTGLMDMLAVAPGTTCNTNRQVFQDILYIFKKCKELEKLLKSPYFSDKDMEEMIASVREQLKREKTAMIARHVADVYRSRSGLSPLDTDTSLSTCAGSTKDLDIRSDISKIPDIKTDLTQNSEFETDVSHNSEIGTDVIQNCYTRAAIKQQDEDSKTADLDEGRTSTEGAAAAGSESGAGATSIDTTCIPMSKKEISLQNLHDVLAEHNTDINDPIFKLIFASTFEALVQHRNSKDHHSSGQSPNDKIGQGNSEKDMMFEELQWLKSRFETKSNCSTTSDGGRNDNHEGNSDSSGYDTGATVDNIRISKNTNPASEETDSYQEKSMTSTQRELCTVVVKALKERLHFIHKDISCKLLAKQLGCSETTAVKNMCEKLKQKMIESLGCDNGPVNLIIDTDSVMDLDNSEGALKPEDCVTDLQQLEGSSSSIPVDELDKDKLEPAILEDSSDGFVMISETPDSHKFKHKEVEPDNPKAFNKALRKEIMLFRSSLPEGIIVKGFEDRMDLFSVLIKGPSKTPYEDGLFSFDVQLPCNFPSSPPVFHYVSFCSERLNPNLYEDGKVCVSLLGTWSGKGSEMWTEKSSLLQVLVSIQGLILVAEPYFNEAGYEKQRGTQQGQENSRMYNEMALLQLVKSMTNMSIAPPAVFEEEARHHIESTGKKMIDRISSWISPQEESSTQQGASNTAHSEVHAKPEFQLLPASKGFCITMRRCLKIFAETLEFVKVKKDVY